MHAPDAARELTGSGVWTTAYKHTFSQSLLQHYTRHTFISVYTMFEGINKNP